jgi:hypothetical protein
MRIVLSVVTYPAMLSTCPAVTQKRIHGNEDCFGNRHRDIGKERGRRLPVNEFK